MGIFDFELWWLVIIPIAFIFGWYSCKYEKNNNSADNRLIPEAYLNSFNSLIQNRKSDAIKELEQVIDSDLFTIDLQNILGNLYRDSGNIEKSIFIRTSLLNRVDLTKEKRNSIKFELAKDYFESGLLDKSKILLEEINSELIQIQVIQLLIHLSEQTKSWGDCLKYTEKVIAIDEKNDYENIYRNYHCEIAEIYLKNKEFEKFNKYLKIINGKFGFFPRIKILKFQYFIEIKDINKISEAWFDLISNNENYIDALIKELSNFLLKSPSNFSLTFFKESLQKHPSVTLVKSIFENFDLLKNKDHKIELIDNIFEYLKNIEKIDSEIIFYFMKNIDLIDNVIFLKFLESNFHKKKLIGDFEKKYKCGVCGYNSSNMYWQCISCKSWESFL